jgi:hypothetical protein
MANICCLYCGEENPDSATHCENCGLPLPKKSKLKMQERREINHPKSALKKDAAVLDKEPEFTVLEVEDTPKAPSFALEQKPFASIPINPYIAGSPVGDSSAFIGRREILNEVRRILSNPNQNAMTLFGQRRIGKTSLLQYLERTLPVEGSFQTVYFDLEDRAAKPLDDVLTELAQTIASKLGLPYPAITQNVQQVFQNKWLLRVLSNLPKGQSLVLLFDEFDVLADPQGGQAARDFFPYLRHLLMLDRQRLQFVFVLGRNIGDLNQIALSLLKGMPDRRVSLFDKAETEVLIRLSERNGSLYWSKESIEAIWNLTNGHPYLTQALCWEV